MNGRDDPARLIADSSLLLLDLNGAICDFFADYPARLVTMKMCFSLDRIGLDITSRAVGKSPLEALRWVESLGEPMLVARAEDTLCAAELTAARTARPTADGHEVIVAAGRRGLPVAVVSNHSAAAVTAHLSEHRLDPYVSHVVGRPYGDPGRMKPNPEPVLSAVRAVGAEPSACVLVGDSLSDVEAAKAAGTRVIGYAGGRVTEEEFVLAGADAVITGMGEIAGILADRSLGTCSQP